MTTRQAIERTQFWLDQSADWFNDRQICLSLNRAVTEWVLGRYQQGLSTERNRRELVGLMPAPIVGTGSRLVLTPTDNVWLVLALEARWQGKDGAWLPAVACQPATPDTVVRMSRSIFKRPTQEHPVYTQQRMSGSVGGQVLDVIAPEPPGRLRLFYLIRPTPLDERQPDYEWSEVPDFAQEEIIQIAKRMLLQGESPDYSTQVQIEEPKAMAMPRPNP